MNYCIQKDIRLENTCVAFGEFDGIHTGHKAVIEHLRRRAAEGLTSVVVSLTGDEALAPDRIMLSSEEEKQCLLKKQGPDVMISYPLASRDLPLKQFIGETLLGQLGARVIVAGSNNKNLDLLRAYAAEFGFELDVREAELEDGMPVTAERIKAELSAGSLEQANRMLGHPYLFVGKVIHGKGRGRTVGMPTINLGFRPNKQLPAYGVYATRLEIEGKAYKGLTNIGKRPSDDDYDYVSVETFLPDFSQDIYECRISLEIHHFVRNMIKFNSLEEVRRQVDRDISSIRPFLDER